ncbi:MAG: thiamine phosphate synthase [Nitrospira sp.]|nr:thiamine phosphate synthase [Nitrospira sp.]MDH4368670.1 thiamine phosphate synthase [Nitrospira sp.]MDH5498174.1 thiamine phosphate synthase [Nitrospira sp.]MDH5725596.1 thiamine phosphate synthase [Nitrospira sp.]
MPPINFRLLLVTDRHQVHGRSLSAVLSQAIMVGVPAIQLRERDLPTGELLSLAQEVHALAAPRAVPLIVNDRVDLVLALNLAGVHLRANSLPVSAARQLVGSDRLIGISTHSVEEVRQANDDGADYIIFGPIFETPSKRSFGAPLGVDLLADVCRNSSIPIFAIGGITCERVREVRQAGAYGVAVIGALLARDDIGAAVREFTRALEM